MEKIKTQNAIGLKLCHDITKITSDFKGVLFKKGHIITPEDINQLLAVGKEHIYCYEEQKGFVHEDDAAIRLKNLVMGKGIYATDTSEGKLQFKSLEDGMFLIDTKALFELNMIDELVLSVIYNYSIVKKDKLLGATKVIPLFIAEEKLLMAESIIKQPIIKVESFVPKKTAIITTGSEVYHGRVKDGFGDVLEKKLSEYNCDIIGHEILEDDSKKIESRIKYFIDNGAEMILCTGGMSVDPDDLTPTAIKNCGCEIITYGTPILPGAMFLMAYYNTIPVMGLPGAVMFAKKTVFDIILPRILVGDIITKKVVASLAEGGFLLK